MLYTEGEKVDPKAGAVLAHLINPTTELDVHVEDAHVSGSGAVLARMVVVAGGVRAPVRILTQQSEPTRDGKIMVRLGPGASLEMELAADAAGIVIGSFRCGQFDYPCSKPYGAERPIKVPQHTHKKRCGKKCPAHYVAFTDPVERNHCSKQVGHEHHGDPDCGPGKYEQPKAPVQDEED